MKQNARFLVCPSDFCEVDYDVSTIDDGGEWKVIIEQKVRRPGSYNVVYVDKRSGETQVVFGE